MQIDSWRVTRLVVPNTDWSESNIERMLHTHTLVNINAPVVVTTLGYNELVVASFCSGAGIKGKKYIPVDFMIYL